MENIDNQEEFELQERFMIFMDGHALFFNGEQVDDESDDESEAELNAREAELDDWEAELNAWEEELNEFDEWEDPESEVDSGYGTDDEEIEFDEDVEMELNEEIEEPVDDEREDRLKADALFDLTEHLSLANWWWDQNEEELFRFVVQTDINPYYSPDYYDRDLHTCVDCIGCNEHYEDPTVEISEHTCENCEICVKHIREFMQNFGLIL